MQQGAASPLVWACNCIQGAMQKTFESSSNDFDAFFMPESRAMALLMVPERFKAC